jgi:V8-like Glu-specific endopeptidase
MFEEKLINSEELFCI